jgi:hypothetical protein
MAVGFTEELAGTGINLDGAILVVCLGGATGSGASPTVTARMPDFTRIDTVQPILRGNIR